MADFITKVTELTGISVLNAEYREFTHYIYVERKYIHEIAAKSIVIENQLTVKDLCFSLGIAFQDEEGIVYQFVPK